MTHGFSKPLTSREAAILVGSVLGEIMDAALMRYDDKKDAEIRERLLGWADDLRDAWEVLKP